MRTSRVRGAGGPLALVVIVTATLTACSGTTGATVPTGGGATAGPTSGSLPGPVATIASQVDGIPTPKRLTTLDDQLPFTKYADAINSIINARNDTPEASAAWDNQQNYVAQCMANAGFKYVPGPFPVSQPTDFYWLDNEVPVPYLPISRSDVVRFGYGKDDVEGQEANLSAMNIPEANMAYLQTLSSDAQAEWWRAQSGTYGPQDPSPDPNGGCGGRAVALYPNPVNTAQKSLLAEFGPLIASMQQVAQSAVNEDPRMISLNAQWTECMTEAGFDVTPPSMAGVTLAPQPAPNNGYGLAVSTGLDGKTHWLTKPTPVEDVPIDQRYLMGTDAERAIALGDYDCRASTDFMKTYTDILASTEGDFLIKNMSSLGKMVSAAALDK